MITAKVYAHYYIGDGTTEMYWIGKYLYVYSWHSTPNIKVGQMVTKEEIGKPKMYAKYHPELIPKNALKGV